jgi:cell division protein FtsL
MSARNLYGDFYEYDSTARKREYLEIPEKKTVTKAKTVKKKAEVKKAKVNNAGIMAFIFTGFVMTMIITYRYNLINEKNLKTQNLEKQLTKVDSELLSTKIEVEQNTDLNSIEAYAKQKLGMQKPDKNQTIYVDTSKTAESIEVENQNSGIDTLINKVKSIISNIF